jgi:hypothetical protein
VSQSGIQPSRFITIRFSLQFHWLSSGWLESANCDFFFFWKRHNTNHPAFVNTSNSWISCLARIRNCTVGYSCTNSPFINGRPATLPSIPLQWALASPIPACSLRLNAIGSRCMIDSRPSWPL